MLDVFVPQEAIALLTRKEIPANELQRFETYRERLSQVRSSWTASNDGVRKSLEKFQTYLNEPDFHAVSWFERYWLTLDETKIVVNYLVSSEEQPMYPTVRTLLDLLSGPEPAIAPRAARQGWSRLLEESQGDHLAALVEIGYAKNIEPSE